MFWAYSSQHSPAASPMLFCHAAFAGTSTLPEVPSSRNHSRQMWWQRRSVLLMCSYLLCSMQVLKRCKTIRKSGRSSSFSSVPRIVDRIYARVRMDGQTLPCFLFAFEGAFESGLHEPIFGVLQINVLLLEQGAWLQATKQMAVDPSAFPYGCRSARATMCARCPGSHCDLSWSFEGFCLSILAVPERYASGFLRSAICASCIDYPTIRSQTTATGGRIDVSQNCVACIHPIPACRATPCSGRVFLLLRTLPLCVSATRAHFTDHQELYKGLTV